MAMNSKSQQQLVACCWALRLLSTFKRFDTAAKSRKAQFKLALTDTHLHQEVEVLQEGLQLGEVVPLIARLL